MKNLLKINRYTFLSIVGVAILLVTMTGVTFAFFNYTLIGNVNSFATGRISFNTLEGTSINLSGVYPISSAKAVNDTKNAKTLSIAVTGDTDYHRGIEYLVTASDVNLTIGTGQNAKKIPVVLEISVTDNNNNTTNLGTLETGEYYTNRSSYNESKYKIEYNGSLKNGSHILVGYIAPNTVQGTASGIDGTINIKAYIDSSKILVSDTYNNGQTPTGQLGTPASLGVGKMVFTTEEWNAITGQNSLSFKFKIEANEGIWVTPEEIAASEALITYNATGGSVNLVNEVFTKNAPYGVLPVPVRNGYTFVGWYTEESGGTLVDENTIVTANCTLYARWVEGINSSSTGFAGPYDGLSHSISVNGNGGIVRYGLTEGTYNLNENPTFTNVGQYTVYYQVTKDQYQAETGSNTVLIGVASIGTNYYLTLADAIDAVPTTGVATTVKLHKDVVEEQLYIASGKNIILKLQGHTLSNDEEYDSTLGSSQYQYVIKNFGVLTIDGTGTISADIASLYNRNSLTINNVNITSVETNSIYNHAQGTITINGGNITGSTHTTLANYGIANINSGTIASNVKAAVINYANATLNIDGGTIEGLSSGSNAIVNFGIIEMSNGTLNADSGATISNRENASLTVTGGQINGTAPSNHSIESDGTVLIGGGTIISTYGSALWSKMGSSASITSGELTSSGANNKPTIYNQGTLTISGGIITHTNGGQAAYNDSAHGGTATYVAGTCTPRNF